MFDTSIAPRIQLDSLRFKLASPVALRTHREMRTWAALDGLVGAAAPLAILPGVTVFSSDAWLGSANHIEVEVDCTDRENIDGFAEAFSDVRSDPWELVTARVHIDYGSSLQAVQLAPCSNDIWDLLCFHDQEPDGLAEIRMLRTGAVVSHYAVRAHPAGAATTRVSALFAFRRDKRRWLQTPNPFRNTQWLPLDVRLALQDVEMRKEQLLVRSAGIEALHSYYPPARYGRFLKSFCDRAPATNPAPREVFARQFLRLLDPILDELAVDVVGRRQRAAVC